MPSRDHFHTSSTYLRWEALHGGWPMMIGQQLNESLPENYIAQPRILLDTEFPDVAEYEVNIDTRDEFRLVAAIEIVSPSNKDRRESRRAFVVKSEKTLTREPAGHYEFADTGNESGEFLFRRVAEPHP